MLFEQTRNAYLADPAAFMSHIQSSGAGAANPDALAKLIQDNPVLKLMRK